ncbi:MAG: RICIN domain-containing protein [Defluviitaleaceae bacterium]|nr:RICIN domain-containing protein [Defluviitaleaceae bacterium]
MNIYNVNVTHTIHGLPPGASLIISSFAFDHSRQTWSQVDIAAVTTLPPERLVTIIPNAPINIMFHLDETLVNIWGGATSARTRTFVNEVNRSYGILHGLVGGSLPFNGVQKEFRSTRTLPWAIEGTSGPTILWQTSSHPGATVGLVAIDHAHQMVRLGANTTEMPFHEVAHNFDSWRWSFCTEAMAIFMTYYYYYVSGQSTANGWINQTFVGGSGFKRYMRSYAYRLGHTGQNYNNTVARGIYGPYGLAWNLAEIQRRIGSWAPFQSTFRHFHNMAGHQVAQIPQDIDKLNYFLSRLQDYSGQNVFNMFTAQEHMVYANHFGGQLRFIPRSATGATLTFSPSNITPWNSNAWSISAAQNTTRAVVNTNQPRWHWSQSSGSSAWLNVTGTGVPGSQLIFTASPNNSAESRAAAVNITAGNQTRDFIIIQSPVQTQIRGTRVIENFTKTLYLDAFFSTTSTLVQCVPRHSIRRPVWDFVHIFDNDFAIRNDTTGRYLTETNGNLTHQARIPGTHYDNRQRWRLIAQADGSYRIRSVSSPHLYITNDGIMTADFPSAVLANLNTSHNRQRWWVGYIWHIEDGTAVYDVFAFWPGVVNIRTEAVGVQPAGFNFALNMANARNVWGRALDVAFSDVENMEHANIRAYGGDRYEIRIHLDREVPFSHTLERFGTYLFQGGGGMEEVGTTIQAGGAERNVLRLTGRGDNAMIIAVFSNSGSFHTFDQRNIDFARMTAMHELGHALGFMGHSPNPNDVMRGDIPPFASPNEILNPAEIEHLRQIYRRFR